MYICLDFLDRYSTDLCIDLLEDVDTIKYGYNP